MPVLHTLDSCSYVVFQLRNMSPPALFLAFLTVSYFWLLVLPCGFLDELVSCYEKASWDLARTAWNL